MDESHITEQIATMFRSLSSPELNDIIATTYWTLFTKLVAKGFTQDQAIRIVSHVSFSK